jgi:hypothetical protein
VNAIELVAAHLADPASGWSIGASGVLAEFMRDAGEPCERDGFQSVTARGAIRVAPSADLHALAYEVLSAQPGLWHHGVLLSLPAAAAALPMRTVVTELGPDRDAIRAADGAAVLFDLGLGSSAFAFCVRTSDAVLPRSQVGVAYRRDKYLDAPADDDKHLIAWVTRHKQRGTLWIRFHAAASGKTLYSRWFERGEQRCRRQERADVHHILHRQ